MEKIPTKGRELGPIILPTVRCEGNETLSGAYPSITAAVSIPTQTEVTSMHPKNQIQKQ